LATAAAPLRHKVEPQDVAQALAELGERARYSQLREHLMQRTASSKRTAQLAISEARRKGDIVSDNSQYRLPR